MTYSKKPGISKALGVAVVLFIALHLTVTSAVPTDADCTGPDPFPDPENCTCYYQCFNTGSSWTLVHLDCPAGGYWDATYNSCVAGTCPVATTTTEATTTTTTVPTVEATPTPTTTLASGSTASTATTPSSGTTTVGTTGTGTSTTLAASSGVSTTSTAVPPTAAPTSGPPTFTCTSTGFFAHPTDPTKYYQCVLIGAQFYYYIYSCPPSACFQQSANTCVVGSCATSNSTTPTPAPTTGAPGGTPPPVDIICDQAGQNPFPGSCTKYYNCVLLNDGFVYYVFECPPGSYFNAGSKLCTTGQCPYTNVSTSATTPSAATTTPTTTTTTSKSITTAPPSYPCPNEGYFSDPADCQSYYRCVRINGQMYQYFFKCQTGAYWDNTRQGCVIGTCS